SREVAPAKRLGRALGICETRLRHAHRHVRRASRDILAFTTMTLRPDHRFALCPVANLTAITSAFDFHDGSFLVGSGRDWNALCRHAILDGPTRLARCALPRFRARP